MGTNYYAVEKKYNLNRDIKHIGKSSAGWRFLFREQPEYKTFEEFKKWLENSDYAIFDEYDREHSKKELLELIEEQQKENNKENFMYCYNRDGYRFNDRDFS